VHSLHEAAQILPGEKFSEVDVVKHGIALLERLGMRSGKKGTLAGADTVVGMLSL
jgi:hypothetical protein